MHTYPSFAAQSEYAVQNVLLHGFQFIQQSINFTCNRRFKDEIFNIRMLFYGKLFGSMSWSIFMDGLIQFRNRENRFQCIIYIFLCFTQHFRQLRSIGESIVFLQKFGICSMYLEQ